MSRSLASQLASLTSLASTQLLPHLNSLKTPQEIHSYLDSLLAPGPPAQAFTQSYLSSRFPSAAPAAAAPPNKPRWGASPSSSSAAGSRSASPLPPPPSKAEQTQKLEQAFAGAGGHVYIKEREEDLGGWGGAAGRKGAASAASSAGSSRAPSRARATPPAAAPLAPPVPVVAPPGQAQPKGKGKQPQPQQAQEAGLELSEEAVKELGEIEKALKGFEPNGGAKKGKERRCFCQARQHPLSPYTPLCPSCALVLCTLNAPSLPCPSCARSPLLTSARTASYIASLHTQRDALLSRERARAQREKEQEARERAAIRFPELGADYSGVDRRHVGGGYAAHAGGGAAGALERRIERAYETGVTAGGRAMDVKKEAEGKVLRLGANGKVKVQTKKLVPTAKGKTRLEEHTLSELDPSSLTADDGLIPFTDLDDDGLHGVVALVSARAEREGWAASAPEQRVDGRVFVRVTMEEGERPEWEARDASFALDGERDDDEGEDGVVSSATGRKDSQRPAAPPPPTAQARERVVPGAAPKEEGKGKKRRGGGGKGKGKEKEKQGAGEKVEQKKEDAGGWAE
ncbi:hypothetical protein JCM10207_006799 [Rhodosporidiobolus poonsookiae]